MPHERGEKKKVTQWRDESSKSEGRSRKGVVRKMEKTEGEKRTNLKLKIFQSHRSLDRTHLDRIAHVPIKIAKVSTRIKKKKENKKVEVDVDA